MILKTVDSTNAEIKRRLDSGQIMAQSAHGAWISALSQTAGRGRQGRSGHCLSREPGEIEVSVKMPITRNGTERPHALLL